MPAAKSDTPAAKSDKLEVQVLGSASQALLRPDPYRKLVLEVASVAGREPSQQTLDYLVSFLGARLNKPDGITVQVDPPIPPSGTGGLGLSDLAQLERDNRKLASSGDTMSVYIMLLDNHHYADKPDEHTLGLAFRATSIAVFEDTLRLETLPTQRALIEKTVIAHEFGHVLGLVNLGTPMVSDHYDQDHNAGHCANPDCLMNHSLNTSRIVTNFNGQVPMLDDACVRDLRAAGGK